MGLIDLKTNLKSLKYGNDQQAWDRVAMKMYMPVLQTMRKKMTGSVDSSS